MLGCRRGKALSFDRRSLSFQLELHLWYARAHWFSWCNVARSYTARSVYTRGGAIFCGVMAVEFICEFTESVLVFSRISSKVRTNVYCRSLQRCRKVICHHITLGLLCCVHVIFLVSHVAFRLLPVLVLRGRVCPANGIFIFCFLDTFHFRAKPSAWTVQVPQFSRTLAFPQKSFNLGINGARRTVDPTLFCETSPRYFVGILCTVPYTNKH